MCLESASLRPWLLLAAIVLPAVVLHPGLAHAAATGGGGQMPWDTPLQNLQQDLTGTTATALSLIGVVAVFGVLIFGGELNHFFRSMCYIILLVAVLVAGQNLLSDIGIQGGSLDGQPVFFPYAVLGTTVLIATVVVSYLVRRVLLPRLFARKGAR